ncbi:MAG: hypothetical protein JO368_04625 [Acidimicrobiales bacterium]|nr:hypothetical protein [Acidimicrobiales bacterium]
MSAALHHVPASGLEDLGETLASDVLVCADDARALEPTLSLVARIEGLRPVEVGSLSQAGAVESFTAVLTTVNVRHKVHASLQLTGYGARHE